MPLMHKSDPEIGTEISRNRKANRITENHRAWVNSFGSGGLRAQ